MNKWLITVLTLLVACSPVAEKEHNETSEILEAMDHWSASRSYPFDAIPEHAWMSAFEQARMIPSGRGSRSEIWTSLGPHNFAGRILCLAFNPQNPNTLYAGSASGGLWRSYTGGTGKNAWERVPSGFPVLSVSCISFEPGDSSTFYIGTGEVYNADGTGTGMADRALRGSYGIGILKTTDGGATWTHSLDFGADAEKGVWNVAIAASAPEILYAGTTDGVYRSGDGGENWSLIFDEDMVFDILVHPDDPDKLVLGAGNFNSSGRGIWWSDDGGSNWTHVSSGLPPDFLGKIQLDASQSSPEIVYATIGNGFNTDVETSSYLCKSEDFGHTWEVINSTNFAVYQGWYSHDVSIHPADPDHLAVIGLAVYTSTNGGNSLYAKTSTATPGYSYPEIEGPNGPGNYVHADCHAVKWHPTEPDVFYVATDGGIYRTDDAGESYYSCNGRLQTVQFYNGFSVSGQDSLLCYGGLQDNGSIKLIDDLDTETGLYLKWQHVFGGDGGWTAINPAEDYIHYVSWQGLNVLVSDGPGYSSLSIPKIWPVAFIAPYVICPSDETRMYAGSAGVASSTNGGADWSLTNGGTALDGNPVISMDISFNDPDVLYVSTAPYGGNPGHVFVTSNGGDTWSNISSGLPDRYVLDLHVDPNNDAIAYAAIGGFGSGHLYRTTNYGSTWFDISYGLPDVPTNAVVVDPDLPATIYVGNDLGVYVSEDNGSTWLAYTDGMPEAAMVFDLKIQQDSRKLYAATHGNGAFWSDLIKTDDPPAMTNQYQLLPLQVFPNPAYDQITVTPPKAMSGSILLTLTDLHGRILHRETAKSSASIQLYRLNLPAGTYLLELSDGRSTVSTKVFWL